MQRVKCRTDIDKFQMQDTMKKGAPCHKDESHVRYPCSCWRLLKDMKKRPPVLECREGHPVINLFDSHTNKLLDSIGLCSFQPWLLHNYKLGRYHMQKYPLLQASAAFYLAVSTRTNKPGLFLLVNYTTWVDDHRSVAICPHNLVSGMYTSRPRLYMDGPCATIFVIEPFVQEAEEGGWFVKFSTARFLRLF